MPELPSTHFVHYFLTAKSSHAPKTILFYRVPLIQFAAHLGPLWPPTPESINAFLLTCKQRGLKEGSIDAYYRAFAGYTCPANRIAFFNRSARLGFQSGVYLFGVLFGELHSNLPLISCYT